MNDNGAMRDRDSDGMSKAAVGKRLALTREALGYQQGEFADLCDIKRNTYNQYEKGVNMPPIETGIKICTLFRLTLDWLYVGDPSSLRRDVSDKVRELRAEKSA